MTGTTDTERANVERAKVTALRADALALASLVNAYAGNLEILRQAQELSHRVLVQLRALDQLEKPL